MPQKNNSLNRLIDQYSKLFNFKTSQKISPVRRKFIQKNILILSPHPDDECLLGSMALRLKNENNTDVYNISFSLGSNPKRQKERLSELEKSCKVLGIKNIKIKNSDEIKKWIKKLNPFLIISSSVDDRHPTHIKSAMTLKNEIKNLNYSGFVAWGEYWGQLKNANTLIEISPEQLKLQTLALSKHLGEVSRNPYDLRLPAWMVDQVRKGSEFVCGSIHSSPPFVFGQTYQVEEFHLGKKITGKKKSLVSCSDDLSDLFFNL
jgi:hypothetical protein